MTEYRMAAYNEAGMVGESEPYCRERAIEHLEAGLKLAVYKGDLCMGGVWKTGTGYAYNYQRAGETVARWLPDASATDALLTAWHFWNEGG